jgi:methanogenic corrinoid protein MtbC1
MAAKSAGGLLEVIETEIIPRLCFSHRSPAAEASCVESRTPPSEGEIFEFARIAACHDLTGALQFVEDLCRQGLSLESVLLGLVAPAARLLGDQWLADLRTFAEVTAALGTLQQIVHILGPSMAPALPNRGLVVLVAAPGEHHTLGLFLVSEFLRRAGWGVHIDPGASEAALIQLVKQENVQMLGITVSNDALAAPLARMIAAARRATRNRELQVVLGGAANLQSLVEQTGASAFAGSAPDAVAWLEAHHQNKTLREA